MSPSGLAMLMVLTLTAPREPAPANVEPAEAPPTAAVNVLAPALVDPTDSIILAAAANQATQQDQVSVMRMTSIPRSYRHSSVETLSARSLIERAYAHVPRTSIDLH